MSINVVSVSSATGLPLRCGELSSKSVTVTGRAYVTRLFPRGVLVGLTCALVLAADPIGVPSNCDGECSALWLCGVRTGAALLYDANDPVDPVFLCVDDFTGVVTNGSGALCGGGLIAGRVRT